jgi:pyruvate/2-oxoglutarate dehydrogenase complex dihydrolipoamide acyltransferase (E2) component
MDAFEAIAWLHQDVEGDADGTGEARCRQQPVVVNGAVTVANVMKCVLSVDHRAIDGALATRWLSAFTDRTQNPMGTIV